MREETTRDIQALYAQLGNLQHDLQCMKQAEHRAASAARGGGAYERAGALEDQDFKIQKINWDLLFKKNAIPFLGMLAGSASMAVGGAIYEPSVAAAGLKLIGQAGLKVDFSRRRRETISLGVQMTIAHKCHLLSRISSVASDQLTD